MKLGRLLIFITPMFSGRFGSANAQENQSGGGPLGPERTATTGYVLGIATRLKLASQFVSEFFNGFDG